MKTSKLIPVNLATCLLLFALSCKKSDDSPSATEPLVVTGKVIVVRDSIARINGTVISDGGNPVTARGMCWGTESMPTINDSHTIDGKDTGDFSSLIKGLNPQTTYFLRAYASNSVGTGYGLEVIIKTYFSTVADVEGNYYCTLKIGTQEWMAENLKVSHYRNGDSIQIIGNNYEWSRYTDGAYCNFANDAGNGLIYGKLYNFFAVVDPRNLCPAGWHVPDSLEWTILVDYLGGYEVAGGKMKETGNFHWHSPNTGATNESRFTALPAGNRDTQGNFNGLGTSCFFWSKSERNGSESYGRLLFNNDAYIYSITDKKVDGCSVRCVRDSI